MAKNRGFKGVYKGSKKGLKRGFLGAFRVKGRYTPKGPKKA